MSKQTSECKEDPRFKEARERVRQGDRSGAYEQFRRLLAEYPEEGELYLRLSFLADDLKGSGEMIEFARKAVLLEPDNEDFSMYLFYALWGAGRVKEALKQLVSFAKSHGSPVHNQTIYDYVNFRTPENPHGRKWAFRRRRYLLSLLGRLPLERRQSLYQEIMQAGQVPHSLAEAKYCGDADIVQVADGDAPEK
ncbi:MAG: hypothetical protein WC655_23905 [Candidatus Hydrogenedentales bacterium]|jgi:tetratricopeptide (TPR) repeat protein